MENNPFMFHTNQLCQPLKLATSRKIAEFHTRGAHERTCRGLRIAGPVWESSNELNELCSKTHKTTTMWSSWNSKMDENAGERWKVKREETGWMVESLRWDSARVHDVICHLGLKNTGALKSNGWSFSSTIAMAIGDFSPPFSDTPNIG